MYQYLYGQFAYIANIKHHNQLFNYINIFYFLN